MFHDETQPENHLERSAAPLQLASPDAAVQRKRMLMALGILLAALVAVLLKDWDFWFPPGSEAQEAAVRTKSKSMAAAPASALAAPVREERKPAKAPAPAVAEAPFSATTERAALPPLQVEVVAGNRHISVPAKSNAIHLMWARARRLPRPALRQRQVRRPVPGRPAPLTACNSRRRRRRV